MFDRAAASTTHILTDGIGDMIHSYCTHTHTHAFIHSHICLVTYFSQMRYQWTCIQQHPHERWRHIFSGNNWKNPSTIHSYARRTAARHNAPPCNTTQMCLSRAPASVHTQTHFHSQSALGPYSTHTHTHVYVCTHADTRSFSQRQVVKVRGLREPNSLFGMARGM